jgi:hypothetical protein
MANTASLLAAEQLPEKEEAKKHSRSHPHAHSINDSITFRAPLEPSPAERSLITP